MDPIRCTARRYPSAGLCNFVPGADELIGLMTLAYEYPSASRKKLSLRVKSQSYGVEIGVSEVEPSSVPSLSLYVKDRRGHDTGHTGGLSLGIIIYNMTIESNCGVGTK